MSTWLITGASRGIGLEFVRQVLKRGDTVFAAVRSPTSANTYLQEYQNSSSGKLYIVRLDVSDPASISNAAKTVKESLNGAALDFIINNAGILLSKSDTPSQIEHEMLSETLKINVVGPAMVFREFLTLLERSSKPVVVNMNTTFGSISSTVIPTSTSYSISKAALNMLTVKQAKERPDIIFLAINPGWVKTDMGGSDASLDASSSVKGQLQIITSVRSEDSGTFKSYDGTSIFW